MVFKHVTMGIMDLAVPVSATPHAVTGLLGTVIRWTVDVKQVVVQDCLAHFVICVSRGKIRICYSLTAYSFTLSRGTDIWLQSLPQYVTPTVLTDVCIIDQLKRDNFQSRKSDRQRQTL